MVKYYLTKLKYMWLMLLGNDERAGDLYIIDDVMLTLSKVLEHYGDLNNKHHRVMELVSRTNTKKNSFDKYNHLFTDIYQFGDLLALMYYHGDISIESYNIVLNPELSIYKEINQYVTAKGGESIDFAKAIRKY